MTNKVELPSILKKFYSVFEENGFKAYLVGGAVRDIFLNKKASDYDVATNATPQDVIKIFKFVIPTGIEHGTVTVHFMNNEIEVTTFRTESGYSDGRHPDSVNYAATIEEDLSRRDFTMNAIAVNLKDNSIVDPYGGIEDIKKKLIKTVGDSKERFLEDGLRPVRAIRFASKLNFKIEDNTFNSLSDIKVLEKTASISVERFRDEFMKILASNKPSVGLKLLEETGILKIFIPELINCRNCIQRDDRGYHVFDVLDHLIYACDGAPKDNPAVRLSALFHDIGKPQARTERMENGLLIVNFYSHEVYSEAISRQIMTRLKFSNVEINKVCLLVKNHMFHYTKDWTSAAVRRFLVKVGYENVDDLCALRIADMYGKYNKEVSYKDSSECELLIELKDRIKEIKLKNEALSLRDLKVNGKDLMNMGIPSGKKIGVILNELLETVLEDPSMNEKEKLLKIAANLNSLY